MNEIKITADLPLQVHLASLKSDVKLLSIWAYSMSMQMKQGQQEASVGGIKHPSPLAAG